MASDSKVAFKNQALELGVTNEDIESLSAAEFVSYAIYAYCGIFRSGQSDDSALTLFLTTALGAEPNLGDCILKLMHFRLRIRNQGLTGRCQVRHVSYHLLNR